MLLCKISQGIRICNKISIDLVVLELWPKIGQNESFGHFPLPGKSTNICKNTGLEIRRESENPFSQRFSSRRFCDSRKTCVMHLL